MVNKVQNAPINTKPLHNIKSLNSIDTTKSCHYEVLYHDLKYIGWLKAF